MPAQYELDIAYQNLKTSTESNDTLYGINPYSVPARASNRTAGVPAQTSIAAFQTGGAEAFMTVGGSSFVGHWSSTQSTANTTLVWRLMFSTGLLSFGPASAARKDRGHYVRAFRKVPVTGTVPSPDAPTIGTATATGKYTATVSFTAPANNGGATITSYIATSNPQGITAQLNQAGSGTITVTGLTAGTAYAFTVKAVNASGLVSPSSAASNQITTNPPTVPGAPTIGTATRTETTTATVAFTAPADNGGATITSYIATSNPAGGTGTLNQAGSGTISVTGLDSGTAYTFTVKAVNSVGQSASSAASNQTIPITVPGAPTIGTATQVGPTEGVVFVTFTAPASNGGTPIIAYVATSSPAGGTGTVNQSGSGEITVNGLTAGTAYTFTVKAVNSVGESASSAASNQVTMVSPPPTYAITTTGLVLNLDAGNAASYPGTGITWTDLSGSGNNATLTNGPTYSSANGGVIVFDGIDDYAIVNDAASIQFGTGDFTLEMFVYAEVINTGGNGRLMASKGFFGLEFAFYAGSMYIAPPFTGTVGTGWAVNTWYQIVATRQGASHTAYRNAVSVRSTTTTTDISFVGTPFIIGARAPVPPVGNFQGRIPVVRLYNRALSAAEVLQNYTALRGRFVSAIVTSGLVLNLDAGDPASYPGSGTTWTDLSGTSNGTFGSSTQAPTYNSANGGSIVFDGSDDKVTVAATGTYDFSASRITIEVWFKSTGSIGSNRVQLVTTDQSGDTTSWHLGAYNGIMSLTNSYSGSGVDASSPRVATSEIAANTWTNIIATSAGAGEVGKLYLNGVIKTNGTSTTLGLNYDAGRPIGIGLEPTTNRWAFNGNIAVVRIYKNKTFTQAEVTQNFNALRGRYGL